MKTKITCLNVFLIVILTSCSTVYYQLYKTVPSTDLVQKNGSLVYEDENCQVSYNFWSEKGNAGFRFYNKTNKNIYLNLGESYYVMNGVANDYYKDRIFSKTGGSASVITSYYLGLSLANLNNASIAQREKEVICIPSMTSKIISEYVISDVVYRDCGLWRYPTANLIKTIKFNKDNSPLVFSNRLTYKLENMEIPIKLVNEFYVTEITNYPQRDFLTKNYVEFCDKKTTVTPSLYYDPTPDKFYIKYESDMEDSKH